MLSRRSLVNILGRRKRHRRQKQNRLARFEQLEDRRLLTISTPILGSTNDVVFNGDNGTDSVAFSVDGGGLLQHNLGGSFGFNSTSDLDSTTAGDQTRLVSQITSLSFVDSGTNDTVLFHNSHVFAFGSADLSVSAGTITIEAGASLTSGDGAIGLTAARNIVLQSGSNITTVDGGITLSANASGTATSNFVGLKATGATIQTTGTGDISLTGAGGDGTHSYHYGFQATNSTISSTGTGADAARITIDGTGGEGISNNIGVILSHTVITSVDGAISVTGQGGGDGSGNRNIGFQSSGTTISSTGTGEDAATIAIRGTGGVGTTISSGVFLSNSSTNVTSVDGAISIVGQGGNGLHGSNYGVHLSAVGTISSIGAGADAATITIIGTGGDGTASNYGVYATGSSTDITSEDGAISITGQAGNGSGGRNVGVRVNSIEAITSTGTDADAATITIDGTGGAGKNRNFGVHLDGASTDVTSANGDISITGRGGGNGSTDTNYGVYLENIETISSTGTGANAGAITIDGTGGNGTNNNYGVFAIGASTDVASVDGDISITGQGGGNGSYSVNVGVGLLGINTISTGTGVDAATITIIGTGGAGVGANLGVSFGSSTSNVTSVDGAISITGQGGGGGVGNHGVDLNAAHIESTGVRADANDVGAATITIVGVGGDGTRFNNGLRIRGNSLITSVDGNIAITGTTVTGSHSSYGIHASEYGTISSTGEGQHAATIAIDGTGSTYGLFFSKSHVFTEGDQ